MAEDNVCRLGADPHPVALRLKKVRNGDRLNDAHEVVTHYIALAATAGGGTEIRLGGPEEAAEWDRDPDAFAARHLGFPSKGAYRWWVALDGTPQCGAMTKGGRPCENPAGRIQMGAEEWLAKHRVDRCRLHRQ